MFKMTMCGQTLDGKEYFINFKSTEIEVEEKIIEKMALEYNCKNIYYNLEIKRLSVVFSNQLDASMFKTEIIRHQLYDKN